MILAVSRIKVRLFYSPVAKFIPCVGIPMEKKTQSTEQKAISSHLINEQQKRDSLAARLKAGDREAAGELVDLYYQQIYLFMRRLGHSRQVSEDLTQESFLSAWGHIGQLRDGRALNGWLYRIAGNASKLYWRKHSGSKAASLNGIDVADNSEPATDKAGRYEQLDQLKDAVARLSMKLRQAVVLHYMQHLTIAEAAEAAGVREGTLKSRLNRALKVLRKHFT